MKEIDVIFEMDWLTFNHVLLNCLNKIVVFGTTKDRSLCILSTKKFRSSLQDGAQVFVVFMAASIGKYEGVKEKPVVR